MMKRHLYYILTALLTLASLNANATIYYVTYTGSASATGADWANATSLENAIAKAKANDEIWIQGSTNPNAAYTVPEAGYTVKSGVRIYGGFKGTENQLTQREYEGGKLYKLKYRTLLSGDIDINDNITDNNFIFRRM